MSIRVYPVIPTEPHCEDYAVKVNGVSVPLHTARVSALPFNRRWPGHQRDIGQSEAIQFLSLASDGSACTAPIPPSFAFAGMTRSTEPKIF